MNADLTRRTLIVLNEVRADLETLSEGGQASFSDILIRIDIAIAILRGEYDHEKERA